MQKAWAQAVHARRERINRMLQQFSMADIEEEESDSESDETTEETGTELTADDTIAGDRDISEDQAVETTTSQRETSTAASTDQTTTNKRKVPLLSRSGRVKRFAPGSGAPRPGIALNTTPDKDDNKAISSQVSGSLKGIVENLTTGSGFLNSSFKNGQEGAVYNAGSNFYIYINQKYWPIDFKSNQKGVITLNPYENESEIKIEVHLKNNTWIATENENTKKQLPCPPC